MGTRQLTATNFTHFDPRTPRLKQRDKMRKLYSWNRPEPRIYSYNTDPSTFRVGYASASSASSASRSARASSVAVGSESQASRGLRATTLAPASGDSLTGYSGFYGRQVAEAQSASSSVAASSSLTAKTAVTASTAVSESVTKTIKETEKVSSKLDMMKEHSQSLEYGKSSRSAALRRAEVHAFKSGKDPRHVMVPHNLEDAICKKVADIHMYDTSRMSREGRMKVEKLENELNSLISSSMSYKSSYAKSAKQMSMDAMAACESEAAASSKKVRKTVVEESRRAAVA